MKNKTSFIKKWSPVLDSKIGREITSQEQAHVVATMLENQFKLNKGYMTESQNLSTDLATYQNYAMPLVRRMFPELLATNVVSSQPMTQPLGLAFALRFRYDDNATLANATEMGYNFIKPEYTGKGTSGAPSTFTTAEGELLSNFYESGAGLVTPANLIKQGKLTIEKKAVEAGTRKIKTAYTIEMQQDLAATQGQDVEQLMMEALQYELQAELDRELIIKMRSAAVDTALGGALPYVIDVTPGATSSGLTIASDGRWSQERAATIVNAITAASQKLRITTRQGAGNFAIVSPDIVATLQALNAGIFTRNDADVNGNQMGVKVGTLLGSKIDIYVDTFATSSYALVGFKGDKVGQSGIIYMPYIPLLVQKTMGQEDASPRIILSTRYAILDNLFGSGTFYRELRFAGTNLLAPGL